MLEIARSKKFAAALTSAVAAVVGYYIDLPQEVIVQALAGLWLAIPAFAVQDYARARDAISKTQLGAVGGAALDKLAANGHLSPEVAGAVRAALDKLSEAEAEKISRG